MSPARRRWIYVWAIAAVLAVGGLFAWVWTAQRADILPIALLAAMAVLAEWRRLDTGESATVSLSSVLTLTAAFVVGPVGGAAVGLAALGLAPTTEARITRSFNTVMSGLLGLTVGTVYAVLGGWTVGPWRPEGVIPNVVLPAAAATFTMYALNSLLVGGMMRVAGATPRLRSAVRVLLAHSMQPYAASGAAAFLFITLWEGVPLGPLSALLMAVPILLAQWAFQEQSRARWAQRRTLDLLGALIDAHLPERREHSAQVQHISRVVGALCDLHPRDLERLRAASRLLDLGRVSASRRDRLVPEDSARAFAMVNGIGFLHEPVRIVLERHRWFTDNSRRLGRPSQVAQILSLADAAARGEDVVHNAGSRFDPRVVAAYESALAHGDLAAAVPV